MSDSDLYELPDKVVTLTETNLRVKSRAKHNPNKTGITGITVQHYGKTPTFSVQVQYHGKRQPRQDFPVSKAGWKLAVFCWARFTKRTPNKAYLQHPDPICGYDIK